MKQIGSASVVASLPCQQALNAIESTVAEEQYEEQ